MVQFRVNQFGLIQTKPVNCLNRFGVLKPEPNQTKLIPKLVWRKPVWDKKALEVWRNLKTPLPLPLHHTLLLLLITPTPSALPRMSPNSNSNSHFHDSLFVDYYDWSADMHESAASTAQTMGPKAMTTSLTPFTNMISIAYPSTTFTSSSDRIWN